MSPSLRCLLVPQSPRVRLITSLENVEAKCFSICITFPSSSCTTFSSLLASTPQTSWKVSDLHCPPGEEPDTSTGSKVRVDNFSSSPSSAAPSSGQQEESDSVAPPSSPLDVSSAPSDSDTPSDLDVHWHARAQSQATESVNSGGGGTIPAADSVHSESPEVCLTSCTQRPRMTGRSSPVSRPPGLVVLLICFLERLNHV